MFHTTWNHSLTSVIDWATFCAKQMPLNGHIQTSYNATSKEWSSPQVVAGTDITISGLSPGLNYGQQCYEGLKASRTIDGRIVIFRPEFHAARMRRSAESVVLCPPPEDLFLECIRRAVVENVEYVPPYGSGGFMYIRPVLFGASTALWGLPNESILAVFVSPTVPQVKRGGVSALVCEEFDRSAPKGMGSFKVGGNYAPVWRYVGKAAAMGYDAVLHLDSATHSFVEEFSTSAFLGYRLSEDHRHVLVVPTSDTAIDSTMSNTLTQIAEHEGWIIEKAKVRLKLFINLHF
ncbi:Aminotransferase apf4 [Lachnellula suecica]|uniref:Aminotransferase apf4 n=1 Tax=Lachnellula suecica TaxID=602035 RepID=A0A8T9CHK7_9HELO|nr:Aminotransferase apf4 [Lachnellula suecica]